MTDAWCSGLGRSGLAAILALAMSAVCGPAFAQERFALVVTGASGTPEYAEEHARWRDAIDHALRERLLFHPEHVFLLSESTDDASSSATRANVERVLAELGGRMGTEDVLLVVLMGHGTFDGAEAKFNLVGPDLSAAEWAALLDRVRGRIVFVNTTGASFPFLGAVAGGQRVVITATDSPAQRFRTVFPGFFAEAFTDPESDLDKDERVSLWEAFLFTSARVKRWYEQRGQLSTERPLLDDTGDGQGQEAGASGTDGSLASRTFLDSPANATSATNPELAGLIGRRNILEAELDELKRKRDFMPAGDYATELERIVVDIARVSRSIREMARERGSEQ